MEWRGAEAFDVRVGRHEVLLDGESTQGLSPMQYVATGVTGCMAIDIAHILGRMRTPADSLRVTVDTEREADFLEGCLARHGRARRRAAPRALGGGHRPPAHGHV